MVSLNRGNEVRQLKLCDISTLEYPTTAQPGAEVFSGRDAGHTMSCLAFTNTSGKSNPGDRVDMDVSGVCIIGLTGCTRAGSVGVAW